MSSPEIAELRAIPGNLLAAKAQLYPDRRHRELLFWLQAVSLRPGGIKQLARDIISAFPERLGTPTMHAKGINRAMAYSEAEMKRIEEELDLPTFWRERSAYELKALIRLHGKGVLYDDNITFGDVPLLAGDDELKLDHNTARYLLEVCRRLSSKFHEFLSELCLNPEIDLEQIEADGFDQDAPYLVGLWDALQTFKQRDEAATPHAVVTSIGSLVNDTLDHALNTRRMVVVEGEAGTGKSHASQEWAAQHPAQARYVSLSGITHRTGFFQKIAAVIGLATCQRKAMELQAKIEEFFAQTKIMIIFDEAHHLWPKALRVASAPELIDWINTALVNQGVPVALVCTDQFARLKERCEKQTGWTSEQLLHRIKRYQKLPPAPTEEDLTAVTRALLPMSWNANESAWIYSSARRNPDANAVQMIVGYALISRLPLAAVRDAIDEARDLARKAQRDFVTGADVQSAIMEHQVPSDTAMKAAFEYVPKNKRKSASATIAGPAQKPSRIRVTSSKIKTPADDQTPLAPGHRNNAENLGIIEGSRTIRTAIELHL
jgi:hypothetical protein